MSERNKDEKQKELDCQEQQNAQIREISMPTKALGFSVPFS